MHLGKIHGDRLESAGKHAVKFSIADKGYNNFMQCIIR